MLCPMCGYHIPHDASQCTSCGVAVSSVAASSAQRAPSNTSQSALQTQPRSALATDLQPSPQTTPPHPKKSLVITCVALLACVFLAVAVIFAAYVLPEIMRNTSYSNAVTSFNRGAYGSAQAAFEELGDYKESAGYLQQCELHIKYDYAMELYAAQRYAKAKYEFLGLDDFLDADAMAKTCEEAIIESIYTDADALLSIGKREDAYVFFSQLGSYKDAAARALACTEPLPATGLRYLNAAYASSAVTLTLDARNSEWPSYIKIYKDDELVATLFIGAAERVSVNLAPGTYNFKQAYGMLWFGEDEMFGRKGSYSIMEFEQDATTVTLQAGSAYSIILCVLADADPGSRSLDRSDF